MPKLGKYRTAKMEELKERAYKLYSTGEMTTRQVGDLIGKSPTWVVHAVRDVDNKLDKEKR